MMRTNTVSPWTRYEPTLDDPWDIRKVTHLHRRAGFGATRAEVLRDLAAGPDASIERLFQPAPLSIEEADALEGLRQTARASQNLDLLKVCWLNQIIQGRDRLCEKLTLFWHSHFATSNKKVESVELMDRQNDTIRTHALGHFGSLLEAMIADPAMLVWLDGGTSKKEKPNENFAREFLELFTLGSGHYSQADILAAAHAFTGWVRHLRDDYQRSPIFVHEAAQCDTEPKTFLGQTGPWTSKDIVRITLQKREAACFLARKLYRFFVSEAGEPGAELFEPLADEIRRHHFALRPVIGLILRSRHFYSRSVYRQRIKSPVEYSAGLVRMLEPPRAALNPLALAAACDTQGQELFAPRMSAAGQVDRYGSIAVHSSLVATGAPTSSGDGPKTASPPSIHWPGPPIIPSNRTRPPRRSWICCLGATSPRKRLPWSLSQGEMVVRMDCARFCNESSIAPNFNLLDSHIKNSRSRGISVDATRREILRLGLGSSALLACGPTIPMFLARSAAAMTMDGDIAALSKGRILVVVQLDGGNDGLNTVVPYRDDEYRKYRPSLHVSEKEVLKVDDRIGLHPSLDTFAKLLEQQRLAIVQSVGYPNPNRSHFDSMAIWNTGRLGPDKGTPGWLARAIDRRPEFIKGDIPGLHIHDAFPLPRALEGGRQVIPSLARLEQFRRRLGVPEGIDAATQIDALDRLSRQSHGEPGSLLQFVERCSLITYASSARLERVRQDQAKAAPGYPEYLGLARRLQLISQLIKAGLTTSIYYTQLDGFDTHGGQLARHPQLLRELGLSLRAFLDDLEKVGEADRVLVLVFSEFGRRLTENASGGTDHGTSAPVFLLGKLVKAGLHGAYPDLVHLDDGDPKYATDFRSLYATVLDRWLNVPSLDVLGAAFEMLPVVRG